MEAKVIELLEEPLFEGVDLTNEVLIEEKLNELISKGKIRRKSIEELKQDEELLRSYLNKLKKENFQLEATANAWKTMLRNKLEEFKEADLKLNEIHAQIQSEREEYCSKLDEFNEEYGVLSAWWEKQMHFLNQLEDLEEKNSQGLKYKEDIKELEEDIEEIKNQIEILQREKEIQVEVHSTQEGEPSSGRNYEMEEISPETVAPKKIRMEEEDEIVYEGKGEMAESFYSLVNVEKVRMANRRRNRRNAFLNKIKKHPVNSFLLM